LAAGNSLSANGDFDVIISGAGSKTDTDRLSGGGAHASAGSKPATEFLFGNSHTVFGALSGSVLTSFNNEVLPAGHKLPTYKETSEKKYRDANRVYSLPPALALQSGALVSPLPPGPSPLFAIALSPIFVPAPVTPPLPVAPGALLSAIMPAAIPDILLGKV
jgi:hypothetical protein